MAEILTIHNKLSSDRQVVKIGDDSTGLLLKDKDVIVENDLIVQGDIIADSITANAYSGMILAYRDIGLNEAEASYNLTTSMVVPTDEFGISFIAPPSGNVKYIVENIWVDYGSSGAGDFHAGLSTQNNTDGYDGLAPYHEKNFGDGEGRNAENVSSLSWTLTGLTAGANYTYYVAFKSSSATGTPHISWGGDTTGESPDVIIKAIALPTTIST